jgi:thiol-disulfide isomerase/thioredoxin
MAGGQAEFSEHDGLVAGAFADRSEIGDKGPSSGRCKARLDLTVAFLRKLDLRAEMKKSVWIVIAILAVIVVAAHYADKATRLPHNTASASLSKGDAPEAKLAPDVTLKNLDGKDVSVAQFKGKVVLVNFWATWCEPCKVEIPWLIEMQQKYEAKGFTVLGVAMDDEGRSVVAPFVEKEHFDLDHGQSQMNYPIVIGNDDAADKFGGLLGYPTSLLIGRDGQILKRITGIINTDEISKIIESQL